MTCWRTFGSKRPGSNAKTQRLEAAEPKPNLAKLLDCGSPKASPLSTPGENPRSARASWTIAAQRREELGPGGPNPIFGQNFSTGGFSERIGNLAQNTRLLRIALRWASTLRIFEYLKFAPPSLQRKRKLVTELLFFLPFALLPIFLPPSFCLSLSVR